MFGQHPPSTVFGFARKARPVVRSHGAAEVPHQPLIARMGTEDKVEGGIGKAHGNLRFGSQTPLQRLSP